MAEQERPVCQFPVKKSKISSEYGLDGQKVCQH